MSVTDAQAGKILICCVRNAITRDTTPITACFPCHMHVVNFEFRQEFPEGGSSTREARCSYGRGFGGRSSPQEALEYLEQNPEI